MVINFEFKHFHALQLVCETHSIGILVEGSSNMILWLIPFRDRCGLYQVIDMVHLQFV